MYPQVLFKEMLPAKHFYTPRPKKYFCVFFLFFCFNVLNAGVEDRGTIIKNNIDGILLFYIVSAVYKHRQII